jgi:hypothetical protein
VTSADVHAAGRSSAGDTRRRVLEAFELIAEAFGVEHDLAVLRAADHWQDQAVALLAEAVAGLLLERRVGRQAHRVAPTRTGRRP